MLKQTIRNLIYFFSGFFPKRKALVFGAWFGKRVGDNSKYLLDYIVENNNKLDIYWVGENKLRKEIVDQYNGRVKFLEINKLETVLVLLTTKYHIVSHGYNDLGRVNLSRNAKLIQLWHGFPLKKISADSADIESSEYKYYSSYDYFLSSSPLMDKRLLSAFRFYGINEGNIIKSGFPRNDYFEEQKLKSNKLEYAKIKSSLGIEKDEKIVSYLPTFRDKTVGYSFSNLSQEHIDILNRNKIKIIEKKHLASNDKMNNNKDYFIQIGNEIDTQVLLAITDILITDFSSVFVDFAILNRPIIHFLYDDDYYLNEDRGIYSSDFNEDVMGDVVYTEESLIDKIIMNLTEDKYEVFRNKQLVRYMAYQKENNSAYIFNKILNEE